MKSKVFSCCVVMAALVLLISTATGFCAENGKSSGQLVYVPVYSHIYIGDNERPFLLSVTLSIRNTSRTEKLRVTSIDYYDSEGKLLKNHALGPVEVDKFSSIRYVVKQSDKEGGSGAKFLVRWESDKKISDPVVESIMIGASSQQGISFTARGKVLEEY